MTVNTTLLFTKGHEDLRAWIMSDWPNFFARAFSVKVSCIIMRTSRWLLDFCNHVSRILLSSTPEILAFYMFYLLLNFFILKLHIFPSLFRPLHKWRAWLLLFKLAFPTSTQRVETKEFLDKKWGKKVIYTDEKITRVWWAEIGCIFSRNTSAKL